MSTIDFETCVHIASGVPRSGKTYKISELVRKNKDKFARIFLFSATLDSPRNSDKWDFIPEENKYRTLDIDVMNAIIAFQKSAPSTKRKPVCIIIDDMIHKFIKGREGNIPILEYFATSGSHDGIVVFVTTQYVKKLPPCIRETSVWFVFRTKMGHLKDLYELVPSVSELEMEPFLEMFKEATKRKFGHVVINPYANTKEEAVICV